MRPPMGCVGMSIISGCMSDSSRMLKESQGAVGLIVLGLHWKHDLRFIARYAKSFQHGSSCQGSSLAEPDEVFNVLGCTYLATSE